MSKCPENGKENQSKCLKNSFKITLQSIKCHAYTNEVTLAVATLTKNMRNAAELGCPDLHFFP